VYPESQPLQKRPEGAAADKPNAMALLPVMSPHYQMPGELGRPYTPFICTPIKFLNDLLRLMNSTFAEEFMLQLAANQVPLSVSLAV
jgi:hypothetical protein